MDIKKFEKEPEEEPILWNELSSFPPGEQEAINQKEGAIEVSTELIDRRSWYYKHFYNK